MDKIVAGLAGTALVGVGAGVYGAKQVGDSNRAIEQRWPAAEAEAWWYVAAASAALGFDVTSDTPVDSAEHLLLAYIALHPKPAGVQLALCSVPDAESPHGKTTSYSRLEVAKPHAFSWMLAGGLALGAGAVIVGGGRDLIRGVDSLMGPTIARDPRVTFHGSSFRGGSREVLTGSVLLTGLAAGYGASKLFD